MAKTKKEEVGLIRCSHFLNPEHQMKCGWLGRADKYQKHLDTFHGGKEYVPPKVGFEKVNAEA